MKALEAYDKLPPEYREIIQEYGQWGCQALINARHNNTPIERVKKELQKLRQQNRI